MVVDTKGVNDVPDDGGTTVRLNPSWPGLEAPAQQVQVDPDTLERLGRLLMGEASGLSSGASHLPAGVSYLDDARHSTTVGLRRATEMPPDAHWFGEWPTAVKMEHILHVSQDSLRHYYQVMVDQLHAAGDLFKATAEAYRLVDQGAAVNLEQQLAGWDQLAAGTEAPAGQPAGLFQDSAILPGIDICEDATQHDPDSVFAWIEKVREKQPWWQLQGAGDAFGAAAERLSGLATKLLTYAEPLAGEWASESSVACQRALQRISATAEHLAEASESMSSFAHRSAAALQEAVSGFPTEVEGRNFGEWLQDTVTVGSDPHREEKANEVRDALARLNNAYLATTNETIPPQVGADLPVLPNPKGLAEPPPPYEPPPPPTPPAPPLSPTPAVGADTGQAPPVGTGIIGLPAPVETGSGSTSGGLPGFVGVPAGDGSPSGAESTSGGLAGAASVGAGGIGPGGVGAGGAGPGGAGPAAGGVGGPGTGGPGTGGPGAGGPGAMGVVPGGSRAAGRGGVGGRPVPPGVVAAGGAGAGGQGGRGDRRGRGSGSGTGAARGGLAGPRATGAGGRAGTAGVMPMGAGRGADQDKEKHGRHDSWLREDEDPWRGDENVPPPVIR